MDHFRKIAELQFCTNKLPCECVNDCYLRVYYRDELVEGAQKYYLTTNEPDTPWEVSYKTIGEEYTIFQKDEELFTDFETSAFIKYCTTLKHNSPPKYIYFQPIFMDADMKQLFWKHLNHNILGYDKTDFTEIEWNRIQYWLSYLMDS